jgi:hypothetical protein
MDLVIKCAVGCQGGDGPELHFVRVQCTQEQYENGEHYEAASEYVTDDHNVGGPFWVVDENDPAKDVLILCNWWDDVVLTRLREPDVTG